jgi:hypothetical protein
MDDCSANLRTFELRLTRLERENCWLKRSSTAGALALLAVCLIGQSRPSDSKPPARLEAGQFSLIDSAGKDRGVLSTREVFIGRAVGDPPSSRGAPNEMESILRLGGEEQAANALLMASQSSAGLSLNDASNSDRVGIGIDPDRTARVSLEDVEGKQRVLLQVQPNGAGAVVLTAENGARAVLGATKKQTILQLSEEDGKPRAELGLSAGKATWLTLLDRNGKRRIVLSVEADGPAKLEVLDANEKVVWSTP